MSAPSVRCFLWLYFFFNDTATTEIYTLSLHDALPLWPVQVGSAYSLPATMTYASDPASGRSEEHTSELQSHVNLVCRLLLETKTKKQNPHQSKKKKKKKKNKK